MCFSDVLLPGGFCFGFTNRKIRQDITRQEKGSRNSLPASSFCQHPSSSSGQLGFSSIFGQFPLSQCKASFWILGPDLEGAPQSQSQKWCPLRPQHQPCSVSPAFSSPTYGILPQLSATAHHLDILVQATLCLLFGSSLSSPFSVIPVWAGSPSLGSTAQQEGVAWLPSIHSAQVWQLFLVLTNL